GSAAQAGSSRSSRSDQAGLKKLRRQSNGGSDSAGARPGRYHFGLEKVVGNREARAEEERSLPGAEQEIRPYRLPGGRSLAAGSLAEGISIIKRSQGAHHSRRRGPEELHRSQRQAGG